jgi:hypothetical protein
MIYQVRLNKRIKNVRVYKIIKKIGRRDNVITKLFLKAFNQGNKSEEEQTALERLK